VNELFRGYEIGSSSYKDFVSSTICNIKFCKLAGS
jgi:hypothetical protein